MLSAAKHLCISVFGTPRNLQLPCRPITFIRHFHDEAAMKLLIAFLLAFLITTAVAQQVPAIDKGLALTPPME